jgi:hypothetical protein
VDGLGHHGARSGLHLTLVAAAVRVIRAPDGFRSSLIRLGRSTPRAHAALFERVLEVDDEAVHSVSASAQAAPRADGLDPPSHR